MKLFLRGITLFTSLLFFCIHCASKEFNYSRFIVGGQCEIKFYHNDDSKAKEIINKIDSELVRIDSLLSYFSEKSLVSELNRNLRVKTTEDIIHLFSLSDSISELTNGLFDISVAPLLEIWGFYKHESNIPNTSEIEKAKKIVDYQKIQIKNDSITILKNMKIDLGGIAQGFAADRIATLLRQHHVTSALINIGGEVLAIGQSPKDRPWRVGIKHPREGGIIETVELKDGAVSTSGDYEKYFIIDNQRYPHIINPKTGSPALDFVSVSVFAKNAAYADAMSTATAIMGPAQGLKFLDSLGIRGIIYYEQNGYLQRVENNGKKNAR